MLGLDLDGCSCLAETIFNRVKDLVVTDSLRLASQLLAAHPMVWVLPHVETAQADCWHVVERANQVAEAQCQLELNAMIAVGRFFDAGCEPSGGPFAAPT